MSEAQRITLALHGKWHGRYGLARCPAHGDRKPSLSLSDGAGGRLLARCMTGCDFTSILDALRGLGIIEGYGTVPQTDPAVLARYKAEQRREEEMRGRQAQSVWAEAMPIHGTPAEVYLRQARGITCTLPENLRFHPCCWHPSAKRLPAMVALIEGTARLAVHRTYLAPDGSGKAAAEPAKAMLGNTAGGAVRLTNGEGSLVVAEGIETALSLASGILGGTASIWAALSTSGMKGLSLPAIPSSLIVATDGDEAGRSAGYFLADRAAGLGWKVSIFSAPDGRDWNDVLLNGRAAA